MDNSNRTYYSHKAELRSGRKNAALVMLALSMGAVAALLFAPSSGQKTRKDLTHGLEQSVSKGQEMVEPALKRLQEEVAELRRNLDDKVEEWRKA